MRYELQQAKRSTLKMGAKRQNIILRQRIGNLFAGEAQCTRDKMIDTALSEETRSKLQKQKRWKLHL